MLRSLEICDNDGASMVDVIIVLKLNDETRIVTTHLRWEGQFLGLPASLSHKSYQCSVLAE